MVSVGRANDQLRRPNLLELLRRLARKPLKQHFRHPFSSAVRLSRKGGQRWLYVAPDWVIVSANHTDVAARHFPCFRNAAHHAQRYQVVTAHNGGGRVRQLKQLAGCVRSAFFRYCRFDTEVRVEVDARGTQCLRISHVLEVAKHQVLRRMDEGNSTMTQGDKSCAPGAAHDLMIDIDIGVIVRRLASAECDKRNVVFEKVSNALVLPARTSEDQRIDALAFYKALEYVNFRVHASRGRDDDL